MIVLFVVIDALTFEMLLNLLMVEVGQTFSGIVDFGCT